MEKVFLDCFIREEVGKGKVNSLRKKGFVPAVVYGQGEKSLLIKLNRSQLIKFMHAHYGIESIVINLRISTDGENKDSKEEKSVLIKEIQFDPVKEDILHIDFNEVSLTKAITIKVPVESKGEAQGVKQERGILTQILWELQIECLPTMIPEKIIADVTNMKIGDVIHVKDLTVPEGVKVLVDKEAIAFTLVPPKKEEVVVEVPEGAAPTEPEVIKKEKAEEEAVEEEKPQKPQEKATGEKEK